MSEDEEPAEDYGTLDAVAQDMMEAFDKKDGSLLKQALDALCEYVREKDLEQDQSLTNEDEQ